MLNKLLNKLCVQSKAKRRGIIRCEFLGNSDINRGKNYLSIIEVEEIHQVNDLVKINVVSRSSCHEEVPQWINEDSIEWSK